MKVSGEPLQRKNGIISIEKCILLWTKEQKEKWYKRYREITQKIYMTVFDTEISDSSIIGAHNIVKFIENSRGIWKQTGLLLLYKI